MLVPTEKNQEPILWEQTRRNEDNHSRELVGEWRGTGKQNMEHPLT